MQKQKVKRLHVGITDLIEKNSKLLERHCRCVLCIWICCMCYWALMEVSLVLRIVGMKSIADLLCV